MGNPTKYNQSAELAIMIARHQRLYDEGKPDISDAQFDQLLFQLREADPAHILLTQLTARSAPVTRNTVKHIRPMLSLGKCYTDEELRKWAKTVHPSSTFIIEPKYDGVSVILTYDTNGVLLTAATRGGGEVGDNITWNVHYVSGVPTTQMYGNLVVRGEVVMRRSRFAIFYADNFANIRNMVAGTLMRKTPNQKVLSDMQFIAYEVAFPSGTVLFDSNGKSDSRERLLEELESAGFTIPKYVHTSHSALVGARQNFAQELKGDDYECDGVVIKANSLHVCEELGENNHHPHWAVAYKFQGDGGETTVTGIVWQVSRMGVITPVVEVKPVELSGAVVTRSTLHNVGQMANLGIGKGDTVYMTRRGAVIPHVEEVTKRSESQVFGVPTECPSCGAQTFLNGEFLECTKRDHCPAVCVQRLVHWCSVLDMVGFGDSICDQMFFGGLVTDPADLYDLDWPTLCTLEGIGEKVAKKLCAEIDKARTGVSLVSFLRGLGIDGIGGTTAKRLVEKFPSLDALRLATKEQVRAIEGIGSTLSHLIVDGLKENSLLVQRLLKHITLEAVSPPPSLIAVKGPFVGKSIVFTGKLSDMEREEARALVRKLGATTPDSVTKHLNMLVIGDAAKDNQTGKREKVARYNASGGSIEVLTEEEFTRLLSEALELEDGLI